MPTPRGGGPGGAGGGAAARPPGMARSPQDGPWAGEEPYLTSIAPFNVLIEQASGIIMNKSVDEAVLTVIKCSEARRDALAA